MSAEVLYPVSEVAVMWRCSREHVYEQIRRGRLRTVNLAHGRAKTRIPESALNAFIAGHSSEERTEPPAGPQNPPNPTKPRSTRRGLVPAPKTPAATGPDGKPDPMPVPTGPGPTKPKQLAVRGLT